MTQSAWFSRLAVTLLLTVVTGCSVIADNDMEENDMDTRDPVEAAEEFAPEIDELLRSLGITTEAFDVRLNRCSASGGEKSDTIYYVWVGIRAFAADSNAAEILMNARESFEQFGWAITRFRTLDNGGVNVAATDKSTGKQYALDSGFKKDPAAYIVGFFNTPCYANPNGDVDFGAIDLSVS